MFKFKKMTNAAACIPEIIQISNPGVDIYEGGLFMMKDGEPYIVNVDNKPEYVSIKTCEYDDYTIPCIKIQPNMVFETEIRGEFDQLFIGTKLTVEEHGSGFPIYAKVCDDESLPNACAKIYNTLGATKSGDKALVTFIV